MRLRECIERDRDTVLNLDDFAEEWVIDGRAVKVQVDSDRLGELSGYSLYAMGLEGVVIYAKDEDLPERKPAGSRLMANGSFWTVISWESAMGVSEVALQRTE